MPVEEERDQRAEQPGKEQGDENTFLPPVRQLGRSCQEGNAVGDRYADKDRRHDGNPHRRDRIACAAHDAGKALCHRHCYVTDREDPHHIPA